MNYQQFKSQFKNLPLITSHDVLQGAQDDQSLRNQLKRWEKRGLLIRLRKGFYLFNENDRAFDPDLSYIANHLYEPSYVSLEYALNSYSLIPERVIAVTSITTRKTMQFKNDFGNFTYQHIQPKAFRGFQRMGEGRFSFLMAEPEKAVVDFLYLNLGRFARNFKDIFLNSYRFQNFEDLSSTKLKNLGALFENKKLMKVVQAFCQMIEEEK